MSSNITLPVGSEQEGQRIDKFLQESLPGMSRSQAQKWIAQGLVRIGEKAAGKNDKLKSGMVVSVELPIPPEELDGEPDWEEILHPTTLPQPQEIPLDIVYEDEHLLVVNKPKHMVVHPGAGNEQGTLVSALLFHCKGKLASCNGMERQGIVHRIDKDTSGLLMVAKNDFAHQNLAAQIQAHSFLRMYEAVVYGGFGDDSGTVNAPIGRHPSDRKKMSVVPGGREAVTHYEVVGRYPGFTHLRLRLETGRTHQIRVHMKSIGHPLAGDTLYHPETQLLPRQGLHSCALAFPHPVTGEAMRFFSPLPKDMAALFPGAAGSAGEIPEVI